MGERGEGVGDHEVEVVAAEVVLSQQYLNVLSQPSHNVLSQLYLNLTSRANVASVKIITFMVFILIGCALCFMGLELDLNIVWNCIKVHYSSLEMIHVEKSCMVH